MRVDAARTRPSGVRLRRACLVALAVVMCGAAVAPPAGAGTDTGEVERVLAVLNADGGSMRERADGYRLVLTDVVPHAVWFSDRPARAVGALTIDELIAAFFSSDSDPNAALEVLEGPGAGTIVIVELSNPRYRPDGGRLLLDARILTADDLAGSALRTHAERATTRTPARFGPAALFVDDATTCFFGNGGAGGAGGAGGNGGTGGDGGTGGETGTAC